MSLSPSLIAVDLQPVKFQGENVTGYICFLPDATTKGFLCLFLGSNQGSFTF